LTLKTTLGFEEKGSLVVENQNTMWVETGAGYMDFFVVVAVK
jgi:hypothetical protein